MWKVYLLLVGAFCVNAQPDYQRTRPADLVHNDLLIRKLASPFLVSQWNDFYPDHALDNFTALLNFTDTVFNETFSKRIFGGNRPLNDRQVRRKINSWIKQIQPHWRSYQIDVLGRSGCISLAEKRKLLCSITSRFDRNPLLENLYGHWLEYQPEDERLDGLIECCREDTFRSRNACFREVDQTALDYYCEVNAAYSAEWEDCCSYSSRTCTSKCLEWYRRKQNKCDPESEESELDESSSESEESSSSSRSKNKSSKRGSKGHSHRKSSEKNGSKKKGRGKGKKHGKGKKSKGKSGHKSSRNSSERSSRRRSTESSQSDESSYEETIGPWSPEGRCQWNILWDHGASSGSNGFWGGRGWRGGERPIWKIGRGWHSGKSSEGSHSEESWNGWKWKSSESKGDFSFGWEDLDDWGNIDVNEIDNIFRVFGPGGDLEGFLEHILSGVVGWKDSSESEKSSKDSDESDWSEDIWGDEDSDESRSEEGWKEIGMTTTTDTIGPYSPDEACCRAGASLAYMLGDEECESKVSAVEKMAGTMFPGDCADSMIECCNTPTLVEPEGNHQWTVIGKVTTTPVAPEGRDRETDRDMLPDSTLPKKYRRN